MHASHFHYLPLTFPFFSILIAIFILIAAFIQIGILRYAYLRLGLSPSAALLVLAGSLIGSYFNIPVAELPERQIVSGEVVDLLAFPAPAVVARAHRHRLRGGDLFFLGAARSWPRHRTADFRSCGGNGRDLVAAVLAECSAACLYQRKPRSADWRRSPQSPADSRARRARRLDWRSGNIRRNFPHRYFGGAPCELHERLGPLCARRKGTLGNCRWRVCCPRLGGHRLQSPELASKSQACRLSGIAQCALLTKAQCD